MKKRNFMPLLILMSGVMWGLQAFSAEAVQLSLDSCLSLAVRSNKELHIADMERRSAEYTRKSAFTNYLPKINASGMYVHMGKEISLLDRDQKTMLSGIGDALSMPALNALGQGVVDALRTDTRNMAGAAVMLTQPLYLGGKIRAYNKVARYAREISEDKYSMEYQNLKVDVEETYWNIVSLTSRKNVAESYLGLVRTLHSDLEKMIAAGMATTADGLSVQVKVNEAEVALIQVDNGIEILKMRLCQLCGLELDTPITLQDENPEPGALFTDDSEAGMDDWANQRPELRATGTSVSISEEKVRIVRSEFLPTAALTGGYFASTPSVFNGFEEKFKGTWNVGVAVNIPILTWGDRKYKVRAAQAEAVAARLNYEELREKIGLQVCQGKQRVKEAREKYAASLSSQKSAEENLRYAMTGMKEGVIPVSNVLEAQTAWLSAKTNLVTSEIDMRLAALYLRKALGTIK